MSPFSLGVLGSARVASSATYAAAVMADSPAFYYPLDDSSAPAVDATGNTTATAANWPTFGAAGLGDGATSADFDGTDDAISVTEPAIMDNLSTLTVECLARFDSFTAPWLVGRDAGGGLANRAWRMQGSTDGRLVFVRVLSSVVIAQTAPSLLATGVTYHLATTYDGSNLRLYINGTQSGAPEACTGPIDAATVTAPFTIGYHGREGEPPLYFNGRMAGAAVYPTTLTAARILAHAQAAGVA